MLGLTSSGELGLETVGLEEASCQGVKGSLAENGGQPLRASVLDLREA